MGVDTKGMSVPQAADAAIEAVIRLTKDCGCPENWGQVGEYPKTRMGKGYYEGKTNAAIQSDDDELQKMAEHMMGDLCTPGNPRDLTVEGRQGGPARLHVRRHGRQDGQRLQAEHLGRSPRDGSQDAAGRGQTGTASTPVVRRRYESEEKNGSGHPPAPAI